VFLNFSRHVCNQATFNTNYPGVAARQTGGGRNCVHSFGDLSVVSSIHLQLCHKKRAINPVRQKAVWFSDAASVANRNLAIQSLAFHFVDWNISVLCKIWGFHGGDYEERRLQPPANAGSSLADFSTLKMEGIRSSETSVRARFTRCYMPEDSILHLNSLSSVAKTPHVWNRQHIFV
jgi:hypothetical protein